MTGVVFEKANAQLVQFLFCAITQTYNRKPHYRYRDRNCPYYLTNMLWITLYVTVPALQAAFTQLFNCCSHHLAFRQAQKSPQSRAS